MLQLVKACQLYVFAMQLAMDTRVLFEQEAIGVQPCFGDSGCLPAWLSLVQWSHVDV